MNLSELLKEAGYVIRTQVLGKSDLLLAEECEISASWLSGQQAEMHCHAHKVRWESEKIEIDRCPVAAALEVQDE